MPVLDGLEFTKMLRADKNAETRIIPIIMLTAHTERSLVIEARNVGVTEILAKAALLVVFAHPLPRQA